MFSGFYALLLGGFAAVIGGAALGGGSSDDEDENGNSDTSEGGATYTGPEPSGGFAPPVGGFAPPAGGSGSSGGGSGKGAWDGLSAEEQMIVELINRARMDPASEVDRLDEELASGIPSAPAAPVAVTPELSEASREHSRDMDNRDFFAHTNPSGQTPADRAVEEGHGSRYVGENIGWVGSTRTPSDTQGRVEYHHEGLWESDGHQRNLMNDNWSEIGVGYDYGSYRGYDGSTFVTEMFGDRGETYLTGVVIEDEDDDEFYDIGEGLGGVRITADDGSSTYTTSTWNAGGYTLALPSGTYRVQFEGGGLDAPFETTVTIGDENVKVDVVESAGTVSVASAAPLPEAEGEDVLSFLPEVPFDEVPPEDDFEDDLMMV
ncbi:MAG: CAP domain-containing protein [Pseudomonadota bacterium]